VLRHRRVALLGVGGPLLFLIGVVLVSWSERDFMVELGWEHWPSGTALGPHGWGTVVVFLLTGLCQIGFALALLMQAGRSKVRRLGAALLLVSGFGMAMLAFKTNHPDSDANWHASIHVAAYFTFFLGLLLAYVLLMWGSWNRLDRSSWRYAPLALVPWLGFFSFPTV
jgi:CDP-diglyceride synthetase